MVDDILQDKESKNQKSPYKDAVRREDWKQAHDLLLGQTRRILKAHDEMKAAYERQIESYEKMKGFIEEESRYLFSLEIWDKKGLEEKEKELGIKIDL